jgi:hypothetical protein
MLLNLTRILLSWCRHMVMEILLVDDEDFKYRTWVAFLPGAGVIYCARGQRRSEVDCNKAHIQLDAS